MARDKKNHYPRLSDLIARLESASGLTQREIGIQLGYAPEWAQPRVSQLKRIRVVVPGAPPRRRREDLETHWQVALRLIPLLIRYNIVSYPDLGLDPVIEPEDQALIEFLHDCRLSLPSHKREGFIHAIEETAERLLREHALNSAASAARGADVTEATKSEVAPRGRTPVRTRKKRQPK